MNNVCRFGISKTIKKTKKTMKKCFAVLFIMLLTYGCSVGHYSAFRYDNGTDYVRDGLYRVVDKKGRIGYADEQGNTVIKPRFAFGFPFENGKAKVTDTGNLKTVPCSDGEYSYWDSDKWYYIDKNGKKCNPK